MDLKRNGRYQRDSAVLGGGPLPRERRLFDLSAYHRASRANERNKNATHRQQSRCKSRANAHAHGSREWATLHARKKANNKIPPA